MARVATTYLMTGDFTERLNALYARAAEMSKVEAGPSASLADVGQGEDLWREYEALSAEAESAGKVVQRAIPRGPWRRIKEKYPPRTAEVDVDEATAAADAAAELNTDAAADEIVHASLVEPAYDSLDAFRVWADEDLTEGDFRLLLKKAWDMANVPEANPKARPDSHPRSTGANSA